MWFVVWAPPIKNPGYAFAHKDGSTVRSEFAFYVPYFSSIFEAYRTRTTTKKAYRTSVPYFIAKTEAYRTVLRGAGTGAAAPLPFYQEGQGGQYNCPLHFSTIVTKQTLANFKARLSKAG